MVDTIVAEQCTANLKNVESPTGKTPLGIATKRVLGRA